MARQAASRHPRVLVTGTGGPAGIAVMKALGAEKIDIFSADVDPHALGLYFVGEDRRLMISSGGRDSYAELVYEHCRRHRIDVLIPTGDCQPLLLASARVFFAEVGTQIVLASEKTLRTCLERPALRRRCEGAIRVPDSMLPEENLPVAEYLLNAMARADGRVVAVVPWARLNVDSGIAAGWRIARDRGLEPIGRQIAERIGLTSVASIQLGEASDGEPVLLEVNPCFSEVTPLMVAGDVNMPKLCVDEILGLPLPEDVGLHEQRASMGNGRIEAVAEGVPDG